MLQHLPCRDRVPIDAPLTLHPLPDSIPWSGAIAYLDRDGVLNIGSENYINSPSEVTLLPYAAKCVARLRRSGMRIAVVTNQSPIGRGYWDSENLALIHDQIQKLLLIEDKDAILDVILHSPYVPNQNAWARKPNPGMLEAARQLIDHAESSKEWSQLSMRFAGDWVERPSESDSVMVGDRISDMTAAKAFGVRSLLCPADLGLSAVINDIISPDIH